MRTIAGLDVHKYKKQNKRILKILKNKNKMHFFDSILKKVYIRKVYFSFPYQFFII